MSVDLKVVTHPAKQGRLSVQIDNTSALALNETKSPSIFRTSLNASNLSHAESGVTLVSNTYC